MINSSAPRTTRRRNERSFESSRSPKSNVWRVATPPITIKLRLQFAHDAVTWRWTVSVGVTTAHRQLSPIVACFDAVATLGCVNSCTHGSHAATVLGRNCSGGRRKQILRNTARRGGPAEPNQQYSATAVAKSTCHAFASVQQHCSCEHQCPLTSVLQCTST